VSMSNAISRDANLTPIVPPRKPFTANNSNGETIASLGITGHTQEITDERMPGMLKDTLKTANSISSALGYRA
jgi:hypothetical protein